MKVESQERNTGMGAAHFRAILQNGEWLPISSLPQAHYLGREAGWELYEAELPESAITAQFDRSNSGREEVRASNGLEWGSFKAARYWGNEQSIQNVIVTRHAGLVEWLAQRGIIGIVIAHATEADVRGRHVVGVLPLSLAALANRVTTIEMTLRPEQRGTDLTPAEMDAAGAKLVTYRIIKIEPASAG